MTNNNLFMHRSPAQDADEILRLIAEGYFYRCEGDRYIVLSNPDFEEDNGLHPLIVWDTHTQTKSSWVTHKNTRN